MTEKGLHRVTHGELLLQYTFSGMYTLSSSHTINEEILQLKHDTVSSSPHSIFTCYFMHTYSMVVCKGHRLLHIQKEEVNLTSQLVPASCLDDNICIETCRKYFTHSAWEEIQKVVDEMKNHPVWYCGRCMLPIRDYIESSIICDCCLNWFHFMCVNLKKSPKSKNWFCRPCHNISKV